MFIIYCFCVLFCYCFKCGLFRKPKLVIINAMPASNSLDSTSAQIISPKHSSMSSSTSNSSSLSSTTSPRSNRNRNQRNNRHNNKSSIARAISNQHQNNHNKRLKRTSQSPTARASSNRNSNCQQLYADPQCYVDFDNDSPFLIQSRSSSSRVPSSKLSRSNNPRRSNSTSNYNQKSKSYRDNYSSSVQATPLFSGNNTNSRSSIQRTTSLSNHPIGTAVALIDDDLVNLNTPNHNQLEPIAQSRSNSRSSLSIDLGTSLMEIVESEQANDVNLQQLISLNEIASAPYYLDEKPPSYDDIIKNDNLNKTSCS